MFRNQYIVVSRESESKLTEMDSTDFDALYIWAHSNLNVSVAKRSAKQLAIIGFNNKDLLYSFLQVKPSRRKSPNYPFYHRLLNYLWPEVLTEPINPEEKFLQKIKKGNSMVRYYASKIKTALSK